jgi:hypothetical protein
VQGSHDWEFIRGIASVHAGGYILVDEYLVHFTKFTGKDRRFIFSEEKLRISVGRGIFQRCKGDMTSYLLKAKISGGGEPLIQVSQGH